MYNYYVDYVHVQYKYVDVMKHRYQSEFINFYHTTVMIKEVFLNTILLVYLEDN